MKDFTNDIAESIYFNSDMALWIIMVENLINAFYDRIKAI